jgi:hypothetical protein
MADQYRIVPDEFGVETWKLFPFGTILLKHWPRNRDGLIVLLDLDGGEWDVLDAILKSDLSTIQQLAFRLR